MWSRNVDFHKMRGILQLVLKLLDLQKERHSVELFR